MSPGNDLYFNINENSVGIKADKNGSTLYNCPLPEVGYNQNTITDNLNLENIWTNILLIIEQKTTCTTPSP